ncbi:MAG: hypothetical protein ACM3PY_19235 [Omnitrophica WOR_2 bacterium]
MKKLLIAIVLILFVFAGAFLLFNFRIMQSQTASDSTTATSKAGLEQSEAWTFQPENTGLYVEGEYRYLQPLRDRLAQLLDHQPILGSISAINLPSDKADIPVIYVEVKQQKRTWTPFYATSALEVVIDYASNGDVSFRNTDPVSFLNTSNQPAIRYQANYSIADRSVGLISTRGYDDYLVSLIADAVQKSLQEQINTN